MSEFRDTLGSVEMRQPSPGYLKAGLERIAAHDGSRKLVSANWRYATISLAILFLASMALNVVDWLSESQSASNDAALAFSILRQEGGVIIHETGYLYPSDRGGSE